ncbi:hypothetical protein A3J20_00020 [Candidatus Gottesmanbacteria bacterium RIFCSPLOWO2_02_FULL_42_29]|nr:MAG: Conserved TM helix repeat-containing protein [Candidatus Gottesmanbacteria bacterium GW2011_GWC2_42_8]OGG10256.1 MAG: hypothetical protein A2781_00990 [Candidatus Gottesmanbacteria bacterium RIFCSPHIGHO2_01_FULL_42_27]OGG20287.1 MAG: hypothetical protein A3E72_04115 [Candidatus Gottesmanbacteria bacterium RIFCSPHIGHO2_12_FULL_43_26]OGG39139.1 MAG: hypothetical protein A3J20_00020 [Candidatus Gottesmanbacteria bacterium RIFCSPLOWO2_02_FULL_42_29]
MNFVSEIVRSLSSSIIYVVSTFMPKFMAGLIILIIGIIIASLLRDLIKIIFRYIKLGEWLEAAGLVKTKEIQTWPNLLAELTRWSIIFLFLMSAVETWGIPKVGDVLNQLLLFLPNVFLAVIIGWIGLVAGRFVADIVRHGIDGVGGREALILGNIAKAAIYFFTSLIILTQLGVAAELVKILFTGIVSMLALSFGLAFGLGGQTEARDLLKRLRLKIEKQSLVNSKSFRSKN